VGTVFSVWRQGEAARVAVTRGVVELHYRGATRRLGAGESWAPPGVEGADAGQGADAGVHAGVHGNDAEDQSPPKPRQPPELAEHTREPKRRDSPDKPRTEPAGKTRAPVSRPPAKERYETAARLERSNPERSIELYAELVAEGGAWAATALFAQGRLEYERGRTDEARKLLERYLRRHRTGANAQVARKLLEELEP
jgi:hypothetical protein